MGGCGVTVVVVVVFSGGGGGKERVADTAGGWIEGGMRLRRQLVWGRPQQSAGGFGKHYPLQGYPQGHFPEMSAPNQN